MPDINGAELAIIALLALLLVGPERLPEYVRGLTNLVRRARSVMRDGQELIKQELGTEVDWAQLDPRQYDPRRIVRDALMDDVFSNPFADAPGGPVGAGGAGGAGAGNAGGSVAGATAAATGITGAEAARVAAAAHQHRRASAGGSQDSTGPGPTVPGAAAGGAPFDTDAT